MPCCHIPSLEHPAFPATLIPDAERFAKYVGGVPLNRIGEPLPARVLTSALHLEMKLWEPTKFDWYENDAQRNSWGVMMNRTTALHTEYPRFVQQAQCHIFSKINPPESVTDCHLEEYDKWLLSTLIEFRSNGLANADLGVWTPNGKNKPPELGTMGLAQKLINIFVKYELCWQVAGQCVNAEQVAYANPHMPHLPQYLCALHAPIDRILLKEINKLGLGKWLQEMKLLKGENLIQSSDGSSRPWSKLDCLRTYYGLQLMLRQVAIDTWRKGCACAESTHKAIQESADWFNENYGEKHPCAEGQKDWIQAACALPEQVMMETLEKLGCEPSANGGNAAVAPSPAVLEFEPPPGNAGNGDETNANGANCPQCQLGQFIINEHRAAIENADFDLPECPAHVMIDHNHGHRIRVSANDGWAWQYHINQNHVRVDRFSEGNDHNAAVQRYQQFCLEHNAQGGDFGIGIIGNGTRSISKKTEQGANDQFQVIAQNAITIMSEIFGI